jgi:hypothetical protein
VISATTLVVAILSGVGAGLAATWLRIRHEREEAFRDRLITAADDLSTGLLQAIIALEDAYQACLDRGFVDGESRLIIRDPKTGQVAFEITEALKHAERVIAEARARSARVSLLFGPVSAPRPSGDVGSLRPS